MKLRKRLSTNEKGRDFVVGDLHGCIGLLERLLDHVDFNPENGDRLISTGDLIDRGPDSPACLRLLDQPWFHAVMGNHELMLVTYFNVLKDSYRSFETVDARNQILFNGGEWIETPPSPFAECPENLHNKLMDLPLILSVGNDPQSQFHVIHGDLWFSGEIMMTDKDIDMLPESGPTDLVLEELGGISVLQAFEHGTWSRRLIKNPKEYLNTPQFEGLSPTYVGHSIQKDVCSIASHVFIDGGAYRAGEVMEVDYGLNLVDHKNQQRFWTDGRCIKRQSMS